MSIVKIALLTGLISISASVSYAHHSYAGVFDMSSVDMLKGRVVRLELYNPHTNLYFEVENQDGEIEEWVIEGPGKVSLARRGWTDDLFKEGELVTVYGNPSVQGKKTMWLNKIIKADGTELVDPLVADDLAIEAERRARILNTHNNRDK